MSTHTTSGTAVRVRFAPSPTGHLHIGSVRTALFNYLFARHYNGKYLLRIEDTDRERSTDAFLQSQLQSLAWFDLLPDEPMVIQSKQADHHRAMIKVLVESGRAYLKDGAYWFAVPRDRAAVSFVDLIRGTITVPVDTIDDFVICRSDGSPMYNFCVVVDDHDMEITHVIRGEDHISNTPKQVLLYEAFGWHCPQFAHLPLIVGPTGAPLSKRDGVTDVTLYRQQGFLAPALLNYLVRLGWAHEDQEIFSREQMIALFTLEGVGKKAGVFDTAKLRWLNQQYLMRLSGDQMVALWEQIGLPQSLPSLEVINRNGLIALYTPRSETACQVYEQLAALGREVVCDESMLEPGTDRSGMAEILEQFVARMQQVPVWDKASLDACARLLVSERGQGLAVIGRPLRLAVTGVVSSPSIFEVMALLGRTTTTARITRFAQWLRA